MSGGLDSALALVVTVHAFDMLGRDRKDIIAVTMPCFGTTSRTKNNALTLAAAYGTTCKTIEIGASVTQHFIDIGHDMEDHSVTFENGQARERTQVLMDLANKTGGMVIGTGDLSELALGWATYNGDHMSMYGVNGSIPKTLVRYLTAYEAERAGGETGRVLRDVLATPVSPELLPPKDGEISQKTEELVGPYELHDFYLYYLLRFGMEPKKIYRLAKHAFAGVYDNETIKKWLTTFVRRFFIQQFKRSCLPDQSVAVPDVSNKSQDDAKSILEAAGFKVGISSSSSVPVCRTARRSARSRCLRAVTGECRRTQSAPCGCSSASSCKNKKAGEQSRFGLLSFFVLAVLFPFVKNFI